MRGAPNPSSCGWLDAGIRATLPGYLALQRRQLLKLDGRKAMVSQRAVQRVVVKRSVQLSWLQRPNATSQPPASPASLGVPSDEECATAIWEVWHWSWPARKMRVEHGKRKETVVSCGNAGVDVQLLAPVQTHDS